MNEKEQIAQFLRKFKIGNHVCSLLSDNVQKWINIDDSYGNDIIFNTLNIGDRYSFVRKFYNPSESGCGWPPISHEDDIEKLLKLVWELYVAWNIEREHPLILNVCGANYYFPQHCEFYTFSMQEIWPEIKNYILENRKFPKIEIKSRLKCSTPYEKDSKDDSEAVCYSGHVQITINKGKKKFKIPTKI